MGSCGSFLIQVLRCDFYFPSDVSVLSSFENVSASEKWSLVILRLVFDILSTS